MTLRVSFDQPFHFWGYRSVLTAVTNMTHDGPVLELDDRQLRVVANADVQGSSERGEGKTAYMLRLDLLDQELRYTPLLRGP